MTCEELIEEVVDGACIKCNTKMQRRTVLEFFEDHNFKISSIAREFLEIPVENDADFLHMRVGFNKLSSRITVYRILYKCEINYDKVKEILEAPPKPLDDRSDSEFASDFASLMH